MSIKSSSSNGHSSEPEDPHPLLSESESESDTDSDTETDSDTDSDGVEAARRTLDAVEETSKFERHGDTIDKLLKSELTKIKSRRKARGGKGTTRLYEYQIQAVLKVKAHFNERGDDDVDILEELQPKYKAAMIVAPPGSGKSGMVTLIPYVLQSKKVLVITPSKIISEQLAADFGYPDLKTPFFMKSGIFLEKKQLRNILEPVHLASSEDIEYMCSSNLVIVNAQKFGGNSRNSLSTATKTPEAREKIYAKLEEFDTIIVDEAHHYPAKTWKNIVEVFSNKKVVFLTATPFRGDAQMLVDRLDLPIPLELVHQIGSYQLEGKTIRRTEFIERTASCENLEDPIFLEQLKTDIDELLDKHRTQEPRAKGPHRPQAMILVKRMVEAKNVASALGNRATYVVSDKDGDDNLKLFTKNQKQIVVVCGMLREGYDNSNVTLVVILRKCKSRVLFEQFCGRCMRMNRDLTGKDLDRTMGTVLSYTHFEQSGLWSTRLKFATEDPADEEEDDN